MSNIIFSFVSLFLLANFSFSQQTTIRGILPGAEYFEIQLITYKDYISTEDSILSETKVNGKGEFNFSINLRQTIQAKVSAPYYYASLFLEPGGEYIIDCDTVELKNQFRPFYNMEELSYTLLKEPETALNYQIDKFNRSYNEFVLQNFDVIYKGRNRSALKDYYKAALENDSIEKCQFLENYIRYRIASLDITTSFGKKAELFRTYLEKRPIDYNNPEFMNFFGQFFNSYLMNNKQIAQTELRKTINVSGSYSAALDTLGKDTLLINERLRDLVLLQGLKEFYHHPIFSKNQVVSIIRQISEQSPFTEHRQIARNLASALTRFEPGTMAPVFNLISTAGDSVSLQKFRGKPVYLGFMTTNSIGCVAEFMLLDSLFRVYGNQIDFITISLDNTLETISKFKEEKNYEWIFLFNGLDQDLIRSYKIKTFPQFILLDDLGKMVQYPAYKPSEGIEAYFIEMIKNKSREP